VIRDAMGGVWQGFSACLQRKVEKMGKVIKKKVAKFFRRPPFQISKYATGWILYC
jgi:hypothetical protein